MSELERKLHWSEPGYLAQWNRLNADKIAGYRLKRYLSNGGDPEFAVGKTVTCGCGDVFISKRNGQKRCHKACHGKPKSSLVLYDCVCGSKHFVSTGRVCLGCGKPTCELKTYCSKECYRVSTRPSCRWCGRKNEGSCCSTCLAAKPWIKPTTKAYPKTELVGA